MQITGITVHASTGFNHPHERFSNYKPGITLSANLLESEDPIEKARELQKMATDLVHAEKEAILERLEEEDAEDVEDLHEDWQ